MQKTVSEMRISDWSSDVFSSDLACARRRAIGFRAGGAEGVSVVIDPPDRQRRENRPPARIAGTRRAEPVARSGAPRHGHDRAAGAAAYFADGRLRAADRAGGNDADPGDESAGAVEIGRAHV